MALITPICCLMSLITSDRWSTTKGCDDQSLSVRFPAYTSSTSIPETWRETASQVGDCEGLSHCSLQLLPMTVTVTTLMTTIMDGDDDDDGDGLS